MCCLANNDGFTVVSEFVGMYKLNKFCIRISILAISQHLILQSLPFCMTRDALTFTHLILVFLVPEQLLFIIALDNTTFGSVSTSRNKKLQNVFPGFQSSKGPS